MNRIRHMKRSTRTSVFTYVLVVAAFVIIQLLRTFREGGVGFVLEGQLIPICAYVTMALSLNLVVGISGELSLGHAGFMSVGAFAGCAAAAALKGVRGVQHLEVPHHASPTAQALPIGRELQNRDAMLTGIPGAQGVGAPRHAGDNGRRFLVPEELATLPAEQLIVHEIPAAGNDDLESQGRPPFRSKKPSLLRKSMTFLTPS